MDATDQECAECLGPASAAVYAQHGASLCPPCAAQFYCPCVRCGGLILQDEAVQRAGARYCQSCLATAGAGEEDAAVVSDGDLPALVAEFIRLHAQAKQLTDRLDAVKEQLKQHAVSQPRLANAVLLRAGEDAVKCGYSVRVNYPAEKLMAVEAMLGPEPFAALFTRKITFSAVKESLDAFLTSEAADTAAARAAILAAAERTEVATVAPVTTRRKTGTSGTPPVPPAARPQL